MLTHPAFWEPKALPRVSKYMRTFTSLVSDGLTLVTHIRDDIYMLALSSCADRAVMTGGYVVNIHQVLKSRMERY